MMPIDEKIALLKGTLRGGVVPAMATPLLAEGAATDAPVVNTAVLPDLINFLLEAGACGLFVGGTTGEGLLLDVAERMRLHEAAVSVANGRVPVLLHTGTNRLESTLSLSRHAVDIGADAIVVIAPYFFAMHEDALLDYFKTVAASTPDMPLLIYDIPQLAVNGISPGLLRRLAQEIPSFAGVKSSRPDAQIVRQLIDAAAESLVVLVGNEAVALGLLALGADGLISGLSTAVPEPFIALTKAFFRGDIAEAQRQHQRINELLVQLPKGARIGAIKQILTARGIAMGTAVPPRPMPDYDVWAEMRPLLTK